MTMRGLWTLVRTEWRGARWLTAASAALAVGATIALNEFFVHYRDGDLSAVWVLPVLVGLYAAMLASDLVAADVATRRIDALALLPVRLHVVWCAKLVFLALAGVAFTLWAIATQMAVLHLGGVPGQVGAFLAALPASLPHFGIAVALAGATLLFSTLLERSFAAVLAGALVIGGLVVAWKLVDWFPLGLSIPIRQVAWTTLGVGLVLGVAAWWSFVRAPIHSATRGRRALLAAAVVLGVLAPIGGVSAWALDGWNTLEPGDAAAFVTKVDVSPDRRHAALQVAKSGHPTLRRVWVVRLADGRVLPLEPAAQEFLGWSDRNVSARRISNHVSPDTVLRWYDAETGAIVRTRSWAQVYGTPGAPPLRGGFEPRIRLVSSTQIVVEWVEGRPEQFATSWARREIATRGARGTLSRETLRVLTWREGDRVVCVDARSGREEVLGDGVRWAAFVDAGRRAVLAHEDRLVVVDLEAGARTASPAPPDLRPSFCPNGDGWFGTLAPNRLRIHDLTGATLLDVPTTTGGTWALDDGWILVGGPSRLIDAARRRVYALSPDPDQHGYAPYLVRRMPDGRTVFAAGSRVMLLDADGKTSELVDIARD